MKNTVSEKLTDLCIGYGEKVVAKDINAELMAGRLTCLIGSNGVGKSTLLRTITGMQPPISGTVMLDGTNLHAITRKELARKISIVITGRPDVEHMTVREVVALGRTPYTGMWGTLNDEDHKHVDDSITMVGIAHLAERKIRTLSDGECQKVMIAKALAQDTPIIILDEPTAFLDYPSKVEAMQLLSRLASDSDNPKAILLSTHDLEMAMRMADTIWLMSSAGTLNVTTPDEIKADRKEQLSIEDLCALFN